jgi:ornithine cyclodeaminase/alanine dehydrogenase-like protein (mu-crystallin family)
VTPTDVVSGFGRLIGLDAIRAVVTRADALSVVTEVLRKLALGEVDAPPGLGLLTADGEIHVKGAGITGSKYATFKVATTFPGNPALGLPLNDGFSVALDARTGAISAILADNGRLTELRTGAAGALAAKLLAREDASVAAVLGAGSQARFQIRALAEVRDLERLHVWARRPEQAQEYAAEMSGMLGIDVRVAGTVREAVEAADILVTTTASREPLVRAEWLRPGTHVTAMGSDFPYKRELDVDVLARADVIVADSVADCAEVGEIHHGIGTGAIRREAVVELSAVLAGTAEGRTGPKQITIADQCGLGAYDAAMAEFVLTRLELKTAT